MRPKLKDILVLVLFATLANADDWVEMFGKEYQDYLRNYIELKNGIPSHDTISRGMGLASPEVVQQLYGKWQELLNRNEGQALRKLICIDGKTCVPTKERKGRHPISYRHGAGRTGSVWAKKQWMKKAMRSPRYRNCWIRYR